MPNTPTRPPRSPGQPNSGGRHEGPLTPPHGVPLADGDARLFVLDAGADAFAALGGLPTSLGPVLESSRTLRASGVPVRWQIPAIDPLVYRLEALFSLAQDEGVDAVLVPGEPLSHEGRRFVRDFVAYRLLEDERSRHSAERLAHYQRWLAALDDHREAPIPTGRAEGPAEIAGVLAEGLRAMGQWAITALAGKAGGRTDEERERTLPRVLVIGAYGGDHIGDTAIVGGVLLRMHRRYGTRQAILVSQRPGHTARLAAMLDVPVTITVEEYRQSSAAALLDQVDAVVFAGGPLMDLPRQLVKHLYTVARARRQGKPFVIEGIGAGPFIRRVSAWTARLLVRMAERITVRTATDARKPLVRGLDPVVGRDPAFDYLETRGAALTRLPDADREWLARLFEGTEGRVTVGINLRPLRPDYTVGTPAAERARHTRLVEAQFEARLADAMVRFHREAARPPCFVFYPMNAIQFGSSDLRSAYRLKRLLRDQVDFRVWEGDPGIDGVIALLRRVDAAITMRFHATIYALAQGTPVIGVDYRPGKKDKVAALLADAGQAHNCGRIDEITADWMLDRLRALSPAAAAVSPGRQPAGISESTLQRVQPPVPT